MAEFDTNSQVATDVAQNDVPVMETPKIEAPFKAFKTQKEYDDFSAYLIKKGEEKALKNAKVDNGEAVFDYKEYERKFRKDIEAQAIAEYERKAKMTAEERAEELAREREASFRDREIALNKREAQVLLANAGFEEDEMDVYLDYVDEDREKSLGRIQRICDNQRTKLDKQKKALLDELQANSPNMKFGNTSDAGALQARYAEAIKNGNMIQMSAIMREAAQKGITLN